MRKIFFALLTSLLIFNLTGCAIKTMPTKPIIKVITVEKAQQDKLYVKASNWMVESFNNSKSIIQFRDKDSGTITGRYLLGVVSEANQYAPARYAYAIINIKVKVKDGATKITIKPEAFRYAEGNPYTLYTQEKAESDIEALMTSFKNYMQTKIDDKW